MTEANIGRLLAASLHQAIGDVLPTRLDFYEEWLRSQGMRDGSIGAAPMSAVLGFLRTEPEYQEVVSLAGRLAARWTVESMASVRRRSIRWLPRPLRTRAVLGIVAGIVRHTCGSSRASVRVKRTEARVDVTNSMFCTVREAHPAPLCGFYSAVAATAFDLFDLPARVEIERCLAVDGSSCVISLDLGSATS
jgi:hypothetical protein